MAGQKNVYASIIGTVVIAIFGLILTIWANEIREYNYRSYERGLDSKITRFLGGKKFWTPGLESYPPPFFFRVLGVMLLCLAGFLVYGLINQYLLNNGDMR
jgi:hypothetical protein